MRSCRFIISEKATVSWIDGEVAVARRNARQRLVTPDPAILRLLHAFSAPRYPQEVVQELADVATEDLEATIDSLVSERVLVPHLLGRDEFLARLAERRQVADFLHYDDQGCTVSNCSKEQLSPGCLSCKEGRWVCVFAGLTCNGRCSFCSLPPEARELPAELTPRWWLDDFLLMLEARGDEISGLSISGGELMLHWDTATRIVRFVQERLPHVYTWAYSNAITATSERLQELAAIGLDEIRFNLAATRFAPEVINRTVTAAVSIFNWVSVEVPSCEETYRRLVDDEMLLRIADVGVKQLNLAEVMIPGLGSTAESTFDPLRYELYRFETTGRPLLSPTHSRFLTYDVLEYAHRQGIEIRINDCSNQAKHLQYTRNVANGLRDLAAAADPQDAIATTVLRDPADCG